MSSIKPLIVATSAGLKVQPIPDDVVGHSYEATLRRAVASLGTVTVRHLTLPERPQGVPDLTSTSILDLLKNPTQSPNLNLLNELIEAASVDVATAEREDAELTAKEASANGPVEDEDNPELAELAAKQATLTDRIDELQDQYDAIQALQVPPVNVNDGGDDDGVGVDQDRVATDDNKPLQAFPEVDLESVAADLDVTMAELAQVDASITELQERPKPQTANRVEQLLARFKASRVQQLSPSTVYFARVKAQTTAIFEQLIGPARLRDYCADGKSLGAVPLRELTLTVQQLALQFGGRIVQSNFYFDQLERITFGGDVKTGNWVELLLGTVTAMDNLLEQVQALPAGPWRPNHHLVTMRLLRVVSGLSTEDNTRPFYQAALEWEQQAEKLYSTSDGSFSDTDAERAYKDLKTRLVKAARQTQDKWGGTTVDLKSLTGVAVSNHFNGKSEKQKRDKPPRRQGDRVDRDACSRCGANPTWRFNPGPHSHEECKAKWSDEQARDRLEQHRRWLKNGSPGAKGTGRSKKPDPAVRLPKGYVALSRADLTKLRRAARHGPPTGQHDEPTVQIELSPDRVAQIVRQHNARPQHAMTFKVSASAVKDTSLYATVSVATRDSESPPPVAQHASCDDEPPPPVAQHASCDDEPPLLVEQHASCDDEPPLPVAQHVNAQRTTDDAASEHPPTVDVVADGPLYRTVDDMLAAVRSLVVSTRYRNFTLACQRAHSEFAILDSGCTEGITGDLELLSDVHERVQPVVSTTANGPIEIRRFGTVGLWADVYHDTLPRAQAVLLDEFGFCPDLPVTLIPANKLTRLGVTTVAHSAPGADTYPLSTKLAEQLEADGYYLGCGFVSLHFTTGHVAVGIPLNARMIGLRLLPGTAGHRAINPPRHALGHAREGTARWYIVRPTVNRRDRRQHHRHHQSHHAVADHGITTQSTPSVIVDATAAFNFDFSTAGDGVTVTHDGVTLTFVEVSDLTLTSLSDIGVRVGIPALDKLRFLGERLGITVASSERSSYDRLRNAHRLANARKRRVQRHNTARTTAAPGTEHFMDLFGPLPPTLRGNVYGLVLGEVTSMYLAVYPQRDKLSSTAAQGIRRYITDHRVPIDLAAASQNGVVTFGSDGGSEFQGAVSRLFADHGIRADVAAAYDFTGGKRSLAEMSVQRVKGMMKVLLVMAEPTLNRYNLNPADVWDHASKHASLLLSLQVAEGQPNLPFEVQWSERLTASTLTRLCPAPWGSLAVIKSHTHRGVQPKGRLVLFVGTDVINHRWTFLTLDTHTVVTSADVRYLQPGADFADGPVNESSIDFLHDEVTDDLVPRLDLADQLRRAPVDLDSDSSDSDDDNPMPTHPQPSGQQHPLQSTPDASRTDVLPRTPPTLDLDAPPPLSPHNIDGDAGASSPPPLTRDRSTNDTIDLDHYYPRGLEPPSSSTDGHANSGGETLEKSGRDHSSSAGHETGKADSAGANDPSVDVPRSRYGRALKPKRFDSVADAVLWSQHEADDTRRATQHVLDNLDVTELSAVETPAVPRGDGETTVLKPRWDKHYLSYEDRLRDVSAWTFGYLINDLNTDGSDVFHVEAELNDDTTRDFFAGVDNYDPGYQHPQLRVTFYQSNVEIDHAFNQTDVVVHSDDDDDEGCYSIGHSAFVGTDKRVQYVSHGERTHYNPDLVETDLQLGNVFGSITEHDIYIPNTLEEALRTPQAEQWREAVDREMAQCRDYQTWNEMPLTDIRRKFPGVKPIGTRLVFKVVFNKDGDIEKFKARLVVLGYRQQEGVHFFDVYNAVPRQPTFKMVLASAVQLRMKLYTWDIGNAFLESECDTLIVIRFPPGLRTFDEHGRELYGVLLKNLYGTHQAPRSFGKRWCTFMRAVKLNGDHLEQSANDPTLWILKRRRSGWRGAPDDTEHGYDTIALICSWIDDVIGAFLRDALKSEYDQQMRNTWRKVTGGKSAEWYLKCSIVYNVEKGTLDLTQTQLIEKTMLAVLGTTDAAPVDTPAVVGQKLVPATPDTELTTVVAKVYRRGVGMCMWLWCLTRFDIGWALIQLCRFVANPSATHLRALKRLVRWLGCTRHQGLHFDAASPNDCIHGPGTRPLELTAASDCGFAANHDYTSNGAYIVLLGGAPIVVKVWILKMHIWSAHEGETIVASECTREVMHHRQLLAEMGLGQTQPTPIYVDNEQTVIHAKDVRITDKSKHIRMRDWYIRERKLAGDVICLKAKGADLIIDCLTKQLDRTSHNRHYPRILGYDGRGRK